MENMTDQTILLVFGIILIIFGAVSLICVCVSLARKTLSRQQRLFYSIGSLAFILCGAYLAAGLNTSEKATSLEENLIRQAEELNQRLPRMLDENTRFDDVSVYGTEIYYRNTVVNSTAGQVDMAAFQQIMYEKLTNYLCPQQEIAELLRRGVTYRYNYFGNQGGLISSVIISRETCGIR